MLIGFLALAIAAAAPPPDSGVAVPANATPCARLPAAGRVAEATAGIIILPKPVPGRGLSCPLDFKLDLKGRLPRCIGHGTRTTAGSPQAICYAEIPFGPLDPIADRSRPTRTCEANKTTNVLRLAGANIGWSDTVLTAKPAEGIALQALTDTSDKAPDAENPVLQHCFAFNCRLVRMVTDVRAADVVMLRLSLPGREPLEQMVRLRPQCAAAERR